MLRRRFAARPPRADFCDACGCVCDAGRRADTLRERTRERALANRVGLA